MPGLVWTGKTKEMLDIAVTRCKKQYPAANGVLIKDWNFTQVEAILLDGQ